MRCSLRWLNYSMNCVISSRVLRLLLDEAVLLLTEVVHLFRQSLACDMLTDRFHLR